MHRSSRFFVLFGLVGLLSLLPPQLATATDPTDILRIREETNKRSELQREQQRARKRAYENRPTELDSRLQQRKPKIEERKVSQRQRRKTVEVRKSESESVRRLRNRLNERASVRTSAALEKLRADIVLAVNREREEAGARPLRRNLQLQASAQAYAEDMKSRNFFSHESPEGETPQNRIQRGGYGNITGENCDCHSFTAAFGENLARGQQTAEDVINDWMESPTHRANMLSERFKEIGIGIEGSYWVQHFGAVETVPR
ncbi:MAG: hypothetical protein Greene041662_8 [Candidatus Peregrinibacteria bacterium Greene0416_62]|nr:MAG: hypothetical protein Greene041662_8 [Candidatus Peregrinibacteria bacterium Greene0416_62]TSC99767.1 MAG: hypothetical protein Greene101449_544 [Candidatus Peregrinibacteria bacterium Greene1014_49]